VALIDEYEYVHIPRGYEIPLSVRGEGGVQKGTDTEEHINFL